jgi:hypothetical protein
MNVIPAFLAKIELFPPKKKFRSPLGDANCIACINKKDFFILNLVIRAC